MARVLVIDDDAVTRALVRHMLVGEGHQVDEASDGREGLRVFGKNKPDLVLTDINMTGLDGHDVIAAIRMVHAKVPESRLLCSLGTSQPRLRYRYQGIQIQLSVDARSL